jgi:hypothetical protein
MFVPLAHQLGFLVPAPALPHNCHGHEFTITPYRQRARARTQRRNLLPQFINDALHRGYNVIEVRYQRCVLQRRCVCSAKNAHTILEDKSCINCN